MQHEYDYQPNLSVGRVSLEMSLKPFTSLAEEDMAQVCRTLFEEWKPLLRHADACAVMFWTADGSEILEYSGDLRQSFNWCKWIGIGNPRKAPETLSRSEWYDLHERPFPYRGAAEEHEVTYGDLKRMIAVMKRVGREMTGLEISVIETFDPGPEFAPSDFKFNRHREISDKGELMGLAQWVDCAATLHAEDRAYAAFPDGIPEGTPFGTFLGRQLMALCRDVGFDGIWLSNGFGFSLSSWKWKGQLFDGKSFDFTNAQAVCDGINQFWVHFTRETGEMRIETRGSNLSTGMDIAEHGCPIDDIYSYNIVTPPNSPWAALDSRFGLELCGYLSHIASLSRNGFLFRYYTHDPWWQNSPWFDRYGRSPHDIYLPLALARMDEHGEITHPCGINFLSADDSFGNLPEKCPPEVIPHILEGYNTYSDGAGKVTWLYPFRYYCELGLRQGKMDRMLMDDWFIEAAIDLGLPLNTVVSDENFMQIAPERFADTVLLTPVPEAGSSLEKCVLRAVENGLKLVLYGSAAHASPEILSLIGVRIGTPLDGTEFIESDKFTPDSFECGEISRRLIHVPLVSGGAITEEASGEAETVASVQNAAGEMRPYATFRADRQVAWVRGSFPHDGESEGHLPGVRKPSAFYPCAVLMRQVLSLFGLVVRFRAFSPDEKLPLMLFSRHQNGYYQTAFAKNITVTTVLSDKYGAPVATGTEAIVENDTAYAPALKWQHDELRVFIRQKARSCVSVRPDYPRDTLMNDHLLKVDGLSDATVTFFAPKDTEVAFVQDSSWGKILWQSDIPVTANPDGSYTAAHCNGLLCITWQKKSARAELIRNGYAYGE